MNSSLKHVLVYCISGAVSLALLSVVLMLLRHFESPRLRVTDSPSVEDSGTGKNEGAAQGPLVLGGGEDRSVDSEWKEPPPQLLFECRDPDGRHVSAAIRVVGDESGATIAEGTYDTESAGSFAVRITQPARRVVVTAVSPLWGTVRKAVAVPRHGNHSEELVFSGGGVVIRIENNEQGMDSAISEARPTVRVVGNNGWTSDTPDTWREHLVAEWSSLPPGIYAVQVVSGDRRQQVIAEITSGNDTHLVCDLSVPFEAVFSGAAFIGDMPLSNGSITAQLSNTRGGYAEYVIRTDQDGRFSLATGTSSALAGSTVVWACQSCPSGSWEHVSQEVKAFNDELAIRFPRAKEQLWRVQDPAGAAIPHARIYLRDKTTNAGLAMIRLDRYGLGEMRGVPEGVYEAELRPPMAPGRAMWSGAVEVSGAYEQELSVPLVDAITVDLLENDREEGDRILVQVEDSQGRVLLSSWILSGFSGATFRRPASAAFVQVFSPTAGYGGRRLAGTGEVTSVALEEPVEATVAFVDESGEPLSGPFEMELPEFPSLRGDLLGAEVIKPSSSATAAFEMKLYPGLSMRISCQGAVASGFFDDWWGAKRITLSTKSR